MIAMILRHMKNPKPIEGVDYYIEPVPFFKKNREKAAALAAAKEAENGQGGNEDVHKN